MVLSTEWSQVEVIDLVNDGIGFGFGIVGGKSTGVVVKSILPGGIADRDGRLQSGDHILQIGDVYARGLGSEHVATVLRQSSIQVRLVVARPVEPTSADFRALGSHAPIVPTKILTDPDELEQLLLQNGYPETFDASTPIQEMYDQFEQSEQSELRSGIVDVPQQADVLVSPPEISVSADGSPSQDSESDELPETETIVVELERNVFGLGITVAGYVWEREDLSGIFIKGISEGSAADLCQPRIRLNDRIVEVDGRSLRGFGNHEAVETLRQTGAKVNLRLERYLRGPRYEHLQNALHTSPQPEISPPSPSVTTLSWFPVQTDAENTVIEPEPESHTTIDSTIFEPPDPDTVEIFVDTHFESDSTPDLDEAIKHKWESIVGSKTEIVVTQLRKLRGLGISLEGTVEVEDGIELRPRHYIRSILPEGPVGRNGILSSGDELLEVNGQRLLGRNHMEVVKILKDLPETVRMVCARVEGSRVINTAQDREAFAARSILGGSLKTLLDPPLILQEKVAKAQSDGSLNTSSTATLAEENGNISNTNTNGLENGMCESCNIVKCVVNGSDIDLDQETVRTIMVHHSNESGESLATATDRKSPETNDAPNCEENVNSDVVNSVDNSEPDIIRNLKNSQQNDLNKLINLEHDTGEDVDNDYCDMNAIISICDKMSEMNENGLTSNSADDVEIGINSDNKTDDSILNIIEEYSSNIEINIDVGSTDTNDSSNIDQSCHQNDPILTAINPLLDGVKKSNLERQKSSSLESVTYLAMWSEEIETIELHKGPKGFGFSILDYQDPLDSDGTVIVVRSLVPRGIAECDGRIRPGDRLMSVNNASLANVSLETAVRALKGAPLGNVKIGISKPLPPKREDGSTPGVISDDFFIW